MKDKELEVKKIKMKMQMNMVKWKCIAENRNENRKIGMNKNNILSQNKNEGNMGKATEIYFREGEK